MRHVIILSIVFFFANSAFSEDRQATDTAGLLKADTSITVQPSADTILKILALKGQRVKIDLKKSTAPVKNAWTLFKERISLRQTFQSVKDKDEAAFANLVFPKDSVSSQNFSLAVGYNVFSVEHSATLNPFFEWQKNTLTSKKQDAQFAGFSFQAPLWNLLITDRIWVPYIISNLNYKNDKVKKTEGTQFSFYVSPVFAAINGHRYPLPDMDMPGSILHFVYNIYGGMEFENRSKVPDPAQKGSVMRWYFRATAKLYPFSAALKDIIELVPDFTYRYGFVNNSTAEEKSNRIWKLSANIKILDKKTSKLADVKLGYDFTSGVDPTKGFDDQQVSTISLKIKI